MVGCLIYFAGKIFLLTFIIITNEQCDGSTFDTTMYEIPANNRDRFLLMDCQAATSEDINCRCIALKAICQQADTKNCRNCHCLSQWNIRTFYVKKRYGAVCLSKNNLMKAAGFGQPFVVYNPNSKVCSRIDGSTRSKIYHTPLCRTSDPLQRWFWTPGNLLMSGSSFTCLTIEEKVKPYRNMYLSRCDSSLDIQKWRCNAKFWLGVSSEKNSSNITHAMRYYFIKTLLSARSVITKIDSGNTWTMYPTRNLSVCESRSQEGNFYLNESKLGISQIDVLLMCSEFPGGCSQRLFSSSNVGNLSNCTILWEESALLAFKESEPSFTLENDRDGIYFKWKSDPYSSLAGTLFNSTIKCLGDNNKFQEFNFPFRIKNIFHRRLPGCYQFIQSRNKNHLESHLNIPVLELNNDCVESVCSREVEAPLKLNRSRAVCFIVWSESTTSINESSWRRVDNATELFSLKKVGKKSLYLLWKTANISVLKCLAFNLTIFCYDDYDVKYSVAEKSCLVFRTEYTVGGFDNMSTDQSAQLEIILPVVVLVILLLVLIIAFGFCHRTRRMKKKPSQANLHLNVENQYSNASDNSGSSFPRNGIESEDNPCYEECTAIAHPTVTIARNKLYEHTVVYNNQRPDSDIYEKPIQSVKLRKKAFQNDDSAKPRNTPIKQPKLPPEKVNNEKDLNSAEVSPSGGIETEIPELYDQPLDFIPNKRKPQEVSQGGKDVLQLPQVAAFDNRLSSPYDKPLPLSPEEIDCNVYDYATREELLEGKPRRPNNSSPERDTSYSSNAAQDGPFYDVLDHPNEEI